jgi:hypothetical protein
MERNCLKTKIEILNGKNISQNEIANDIRRSY